MCDFFWYLSYFSSNFNYFFQVADEFRDDCNFHVGVGYVNRAVFKKYFHDN